MKRLFSTLVRSFREGVKTGLTKTSGVCLGKRSYTFFGVPAGIDHTSQKKITLYPDGGVMVLSRAVATRWGGNLSRCGKLISEYLQPIDGKPPERNDLFRFTTSRFFPRIYKTTSPVVTLAAGWQGAFYHWFYEVLVRFHLIEKAGLSALPVYIESGHSFQKESLELVRLKSKIIDAAQYDAVETPHLFVPSIPAQPTAWGCRFLKEMLAPKLTKSKKKRLYISRHDATRRRISNEDEVLDLLKRHNFEKILLSKHTLKEQMELFYSAESVVGPHGAGLSHLALCDPGTGVIEIFAPSYINRCYEQISGHANLTYLSLFGKASLGSDPNDPDIVVDIEMLQTKLRSQIG